jgi:hypothetical protein
MESQFAIKVLLMSAACAMVFSSLIGVGMLFIIKGISEQGAPPKINLRQIGAAHLDWIMLALMLGLAAAFIHFFELATVPLFAIAALVFGAWVNPLSYVFRAFGVNAFVFAGGPMQRISAALGGLSSTGIIIAWVMLIIPAARAF